MQIVQHPSRNTWDQLVQRPTASYAELEKPVKKILDQVKSKGDKAVRKFTSDFDGVRLRNLEVTPKEIRVAVKNIAPDLKEAIILAADNIRRFHEQQKQGFSSEPPPWFRR